MMRAVRPRRSSAQLIPAALISPAARLATSVTYSPTSSRFDLSGSFLHFENDEVACRQTAVLQLFSRVLFEWIIAGVGSFLIVSYLQFILPVARPSQQVICFEFFEEQKLWKNRLSRCDLRPARACGSRRFCKFFASRKLAVRIFSLFLSSLSLLSLFLSLFAARNNMRERSKL